MKAFILAAGKGTRLSPLTDHRPKALLEVGKITLLERAILKLKGEGFNDIVVNVHHLGDQIIEFLNSRKWEGVKISISDERDCLLDTGGGLEESLALVRKSARASLQCGCFYCAKYQRNGEDSQGFGSYCHPCCQPKKNKPLFAF